MPDPISWSDSGPYLLAAVLFGYLLGSIPFGLLLTRLAGLGDVRSIGSGNIGATNVLRTGRKDVAAVTLVLDVLKGMAAVLLAGRYGTDAAVVAGLGAFLGHLFPVWIGFKGGKGVATFVGILFAFSWQVGLIFAAVWCGLAALTRYSSVAALTASLVVPFALYWRGEAQLGQLFGLLAAILWARHWGNILRLMRGQESRIGSRS